MYLPANSISMKYYHCLVKKILVVLQNIPLCLLMLQTVQFSCHFYISCSSLYVFFPFVALPYVLNHYSQRLHSPINTGAIFLPFHFKVDMLLFLPRFTASVQSSQPRNTVERKESCLGYRSIHIMWMMTVQRNLFMRLAVKSRSSR